MKLIIYAEDEFGYIKRTRIFDFGREDILQKLKVSLMDTGMSRDDYDKFFSIQEYEITVKRRIKR